MIDTTLQEQVKLNQVPTGIDVQSYANFKKANPGIAFTQQDLQNFQGAGQTSQNTSFPYSVPSGTSTTLSANNIGVSPLKIPEAIKVPPITPTVTNPLGTTVDTNGNAMITPPEKSNYQQTLEKMGILGDTLATKPEVTRQLQEEQQLAQKTEQATKDYNAYNQKKLQYQQTIESMRNEIGGTTGGNQDKIALFSRNANADLANLAVIAQSSQGLLTAAQQTIKYKLDAQFQPIQDQIDYLTKFATLNANDLTEKEKFQIQQKADEKKTDLANVQKTADDLHQAILQNNAPVSVYSALDKVTHDFIDGKITASEAQTKMYQAVGSYGVDKVKQLQMANLQSEIDARRVSTQQAINTLPSAVQTRVQGVAGQFDSEPAVKNYQVSAEAIDAVKSAGTTPTDDIQRIYAFAKVMDPNSVVREGEYKTVQDYSTALLERTGIKAKRIFDNSGFLTDEARTFMLTTLENRLASSKKAYDNIYKSYGERINKITGRNDGTEYITDYSQAFGKSNLKLEADPLGLGLTANPLGI